MGSSAASLWTTFHPRQASDTTTTAFSCYRTSSPPDYADTSYIQVLGSEGAYTACPHSSRTYHHQSPFRYAYHFFRYYYQVDYLLDIPKYAVYVTVLFNVSNLRVKAVPKKDKATKVEKIQINKTTRHDFITAILAVHNLDKQYGPGKYSGPSFKLSWTGSP